MFTLTTNLRHKRTLLCVYVYASLRQFFGSCLEAAFLASLWQYHQLIVAFLADACLCQVWGVHSPSVAAVNDACSTLHCLYGYHLRTICRLTPLTPRKLLLTELPVLNWALSKSFCFRKCLSGAKLCSIEIVWLFPSPAGRYCNVFAYAFQRGACNIAGSWRHVYIQLVLSCHMQLMWCPCRMWTVMKTT